MSPFWLEIQLVDLAGNPLAKEGVLVDEVLFMQGRARYRFNFGATNGCGLVELDLPRLEALRSSNQKLSVMDYNTPLAECDQTMTHSSKASSRAKTWRSLVHP